MATVLNKDLHRETTIEINGKLIVLSIKSDQSVDLKLKGVRGGDVLNISILDLWEYLGGAPQGKSDGLVSIKKKAPKKGDNKMISLYDLRSSNAISELNYADMSKFDGIINDLIKTLK
jgi:hypothetical protein